MIEGTQILNSWFSECLEDPLCNRLRKTVEQHIISISMGNLIIERVFTCMFFCVNSFFPHSFTLCIDQIKFLGSFSKELAEPMNMDRIRNHLSSFPLAECISGHTYTLRHFFL